MTDDYSAEHRDLVAAGAILPNWVMIINMRGELSRLALPPEPDRRRRQLRTAVWSDDLLMVPLTARFTMWLPGGNTEPVRLRFNVVATALAARFGRVQRCHGMAVVTAMEKSGDPATLSPDQHAALSAMVRR